MYQPVSNNLFNLYFLLSFSLLDWRHEFRDIQFPRPMGATWQKPLCSGWGQRRGLLKGRKCSRVLVYYRFFRQVKARGDSDFRSQPNSNDLRKRCLSAFDSCICFFEVCNRQQNRAFSIKKTMRYPIECFYLTLHSHKLSQSSECPMTIGSPIDWSVFASYSLLTIPLLLSFPFSLFLVLYRHIYVGE